MSKKKSSYNFEDKLLRLEEITQSLENSDLGLEQSITLFEEGVSLSKECLSILAKTELRVNVLKKDLDSLNISNRDSTLSNYWSSLMSDAEKYPVLSKVNYPSDIKRWILLN